MKAFRKVLASVALAMACAGSMLAALPAYAGPDRAWRVDPDTLPAAERQEALTAPLGRYGPSGEFLPPGCIWTRIEVPTTQGLRWMLEENCDNQGQRW